MLQRSTIIKVPIGRPRNACGQLATGLAIISCPSCTDSRAIPNLVAAVVAIIVGMWAAPIKPTLNGCPSYPQCRGDA